jgi:hypothetical protein
MLNYSSTAAGCNVTELKVKYFDTIPVCTAMCILKTGFLFAASESGDHGYYDFLSLGEDDNANEASSANLVETDGGYQAVFFDPQPMTNLALQDTLMSLAPMTDMKVANMLAEVRLAAGAHHKACLSVSAQRCAATLDCSGLCMRARTAP